MNAITPPFPGGAKLISEKATDHTPFITVLIPTYQSEAYISSTINSVIEIPNVEVIVVDDSSTDRTIQVSIELLSDIPHKVLSVPRQGSPGLGRNLGIRLSSGKHILFLDSDDCVIGSSLVGLIKNHDLTGIDMCILQYLCLYEDNTAFTLGYDSEKFVSICKSILHIDSFKKTPEIVRLSPHPSRTLYSRKFLTDQELKFKEKVNFEDGEFWVQAILTSERVALFSYPSVIYRIRRGSITNSKDLNKLFGLHVQFEAINRIVFGGEMSSITKNQIYLYCLEMLLWPIYQLERSQRRIYIRRTTKLLMRPESRWLSIVNLRKDERRFVLKFLQQFLRLFLL